MPENPFPATLAEARTSFLAAAEAAGARIGWLPIAARGPAGETLEVAWASLGPERPRKLVVHACGVHGVEGFAGSPIQAAVLRSPPALPGDTGVLFLHGVNPYGMAWLRRWNEENVDLNRNCLGDAVRNATEGPEPAAERWPGYEGAPALYAELNSLLNPAGVPGWFDTFYLQALWQVLRHGFAPLQQAIAEGQYEFPQGLFFGGHRLAEGPRKIFAAIRASLAAAETVVACDIHTGLGPYGIDALLIDEPAGTDMARALAAHFGERVSPPELGKAYAVRGSFLEGLRALAPPGRLFGLTQEFGTYPALTMLKTLRDENAWHHFGNASDLAHPQKQWGLRAFVPEDVAWQQAILRRGHEVFCQAVAFAAEV